METKTCRKCGEEKPVSAFGNTTRDGLRARCKPCHAATKREYQTRERRSWSAMKDRCLNKKHEHYIDYGARGIRVCERWNKFANFLADMGERPEGKSLDRINNDGNYEPGNCRWATLTEQAWNTRQTKLIALNGETMPIMAWARKLGIAPSALRYRLSRWPAHKALSATPKKTTAPHPRTR